MLGVITQQIILNIIILYYTLFIYIFYYIILYYTQQIKFIEITSFLASIIKFSPSLIILHSAILLCKNLILDKYIIYTIYTLHIYIYYI